MAVTLNQQQLAKLKADMANGPLSAQVTPLLHADPLGIAAIYNAVNAETISIPSLRRDDFLLGILPAGAALFGKDAATQAKWTFYLDIAKAADTIKLSSPVIQAVLSQLVTDGLMTQAAVDAFSRQPCSHAETLFGIGVKLDSDDIQAASEL
jgi:hypothetical protein